MLLTEGGGRGEPAGTRAGAPRQPGRGRGREQEKKGRGGRTRHGNGAAQLRALSTPGGAAPLRPPPRGAQDPRPQQAPRARSPAREQDADVAAPLIHASCLGQGRKAASSPGNDCISKSRLTIPLTAERERRQRGEAPKCFSSVLPAEPK